MANASMYAIIETEENTLNIINTLKGTVKINERNILL